MQIVSLKYRLKKINGFSEYNSFIKHLNWFFNNYKPLSLRK